MSDELRRLKDWDDALVKSVLESASRDAPSSERVRRAAMNLGLPAAAAARAVAAGHAASAGSALGGAAGAATSSSAGSAALGGTSALVAKWLGIGALVGLATGGVAGRVLDHASSHAAPPPAAHAAPSRLEPAPATRAETPRARAPEPVPSVTATAARAAPRLAMPATSATAAPIGAAPSSAVAAFPAAAPRDNLGAELQMVGAARQALARGAAAGALSELDRYAREVPHPQFGVEALMLRVRALIALGRRGEARAIGERYIATHPSDVYAAKLRALLGL